MGNNKDAMSRLRERAKQAEKNIKKRRNRGLPSSVVATQSKHEMEQMGLFTEDIIPANEVPTLFTRSPIFLAVPRSKQQALLDADNALTFESPWGKGRRAGPPLTVFDEDVLCALFQLRHSRHEGPATTMPIPLDPQYLNKSKVLVHTASCTVADVLDTMGRSRCGRTHKRVLDSVRRLALVTIEITTKADSTYFQDAEIGRSFRILDVMWGSFQEDAILRVQFSPIVAKWLESSYTYLDFTVRKRLRGNYAKLIHRFLSSQRRDAPYTVRMDSVAAAIGYNDRPSRMKKVFEGALQQLDELGWISGWKITGTGRGRSYIRMTVQWPPKQPDIQA